MAHDSKYSDAEIRYLEMAYSRFHSLYEDIMSVEFWNLDATSRFTIIKDIFSVYSEIIKYKPLDKIIGDDKRPHANLLAKDFIKFLRNVLQHFPFFYSWDEVYIDRELVTAIEAPGSIDRFLLHEHPYDTKFRFWNPRDKSMTYVNIELNSGYSKGHAVFLSDILNEKDGVRLVCLIMNKYLNALANNLKN